MKNKLARLSLVFNYTFFILHSPAAFAGYLQHVAVDVSDSRRNFPLPLARGEVVNLSVDYFDDGEPLDIAGSPLVSLECKTNGMAGAESFAVPGVATNGNSALFRVKVDDFCPEASGTWTCVVSNEWATLARVGGTVFVRGTAAASSHALPKSALAGYARKGDLGSAAFADTPRKYALDATNIVGITIQPLTTSDWQQGYIDGFVISHPDYGSASLLFPDDFTETDGGWCGQIDLNRVAPFVPRPRRYGGVLITNLVFGGEMATMTSSAVECSMDCFADWQGDSDNIHFVFYALSDRHDEWMSVGEAADLSASRAATAATNYTDAAIAAFAATNPPPDLSGYATAPGVTNIVKSLSLGGIWDEQIQVWWTPRMRNGSLTYEATTNVNLNTGI